MDIEILSFDTVSADEIARLRADNAALKTQLIDERRERERMLIELHEIKFRHQQAVYRLSATIKECFS